jgi:hypothetical protein
MNYRRIRKIREGTRVRLHWVDIHEKNTADPPDVAPATMWTEGRFLGLTKDNDHGYFVRLSNTYDEDNEEWYGACAFPLGCIRGVEILG